MDSWGAPKTHVYQAHFLQVLRTHERIQEEDAADEKPENTSEERKGGRQVTACLTQRYPWGQPCFWYQQAQREEEKFVASLPHSGFVVTPLLGRGEAPRLSKQATADAQQSVDILTSAVPIKGHHPSRSKGIGQTMEKSGKAENLGPENKEAILPKEMANVVVVALAQSTEVFFMTGTGKSPFDELPTEAGVTKATCGATAHGKRPASLRALGGNGKEGAELRGHADRGFEEAFSPPRAEEGDTARCQLVSLIKCDLKELESCPSCEGCAAPIRDRFILRVGDSEGHWHEACLVCSVCQVPLLDSCYSKDKKIFCKADYERLYIARCGGCSERVYPSDLVLRARSLVFHVSCFSCAECGRALGKGEEFILRGNLVFCRYDWEKDILMMSSGNIDDPIRIHRDGRRGPKRPRTILTSSQRRQFKASFEISPKPCRKVNKIVSIPSFIGCAVHKKFQPIVREALAKETGLSVRVVQVWFQNQRAKMKKLQKKAKENHEKGGKEFGRRGKKRRLNQLNNTTGAAASAVEEQQIRRELGEKPAPGSLPGRGLSPNGGEQEATSMTKEVESDQKSGSLSQKGRQGYMDAYSTYDGYSTDGGTGLQSGDSYCGDSDLSIDMDDSCFDSQREGDTPAPSVHSPEDQKSGAMATLPHFSQTNPIDKLYLMQTSYFDECQLGNGGPPNPKTLCLVKIFPHVPSDRLRSTIQAPSKRSCVQPTTPLCCSSRHSSASGELLLLPYTCDTNKELHHTNNFQIVVRKEVDNSRRSGHQTREECPKSPQLQNSLLINVDKPLLDENTPQLPCVKGDKYALVNSRPEKAEVIVLSREWKQLLQHSPRLERQESPTTMSSSASSSGPDVPSSTEGTLSTFSVTSPSLRRGLMKKLAHLPSPQILELLRNESKYQASKKGFSERELQVVKKMFHDLDNTDDAKPFDRRLPPLAVYPGESHARGARNRWFYGTNYKDRGGSFSSHRPLAASSRSDYVPPSFHSRYPTTTSRPLIASPTILVQGVDQPTAYVPSSRETIPHTPITHAPITSKPPAPIPLPVSSLATPTDLPPVTSPPYKVTAAASTLSDSDTMVLDQLLHRLASVSPAPGASSTPSSLSEEKETSSKPGEVEHLDGFLNNDVLISPLEEHDSQVLTRLHSHEDSSAMREVTLQESPLLNHARERVSGTELSESDSSENNFRGTVANVRTKSSTVQGTGVPVTTLSISTEGDVTGSSTERGSSVGIRADATGSTGAEMKLSDKTTSEMKLSDKTTSETDSEVDVLSRQDLSQIAFHIPEFATDFRSAEEKGEGMEAVVGGIPNEEDRTDDNKSLAEEDNVRDGDLKSETLPAIQGDVSDDGSSSVNSDNGIRHQGDGTSGFDEQQHHDQMKKSDDRQETGTGQENEESSEGSEERLPEVNSQEGESPDESGVSKTNVVLRKKLIKKTLLRGSTVKDETGAATTESSQESSEFTIKSEDATIESESNVGFEETASESTEGELMKHTTYGAKSSDPPITSESEESENFRTTSVDEAMEQPTTTRTDDTEELHTTEKETNTKESAETTISSESNEESMKFSTAGSESNHELTETNISNESNEESMKFSTAGSESNHELTETTISSESNEESMKFSTAGSESNHELTETTISSESDEGSMKFTTTGTESNQSADPTTTITEEMNNKELLKAGMTEGGSNEETNVAETESTEKPMKLVTTVAETIEATITLPSISDETFEATMTLPTIRDESIDRTSSGDGEKSTEATVMRENISLDTRGNKPQPGLVGTANPQMENGFIVLGATQEPTQSPKGTVVVEEDPVGINTRASKKPFSESLLEEMPAFQIQAMPMNLAERNNGDVDSNTEDDEEPPPLQAFPQQRNRNPYVIVGSTLIRVPPGVDLEEFLEDVKKRHREKNDLQTLAEDEEAFEESEPLELETGDYESQSSERREVYAKPDFHPSGLTRTHEQEHSAAWSNEAEYERNEYRRKSQQKLELLANRYANPYGLESEISYMHQNDPRFRESEAYEQLFDEEGFPLLEPDGRIGITPHQEKFRQRTLQLAEELQDVFEPGSLEAGPRNADEPGTTSWIHTFKDFLFKFSGFKGQSEEARKHGVFGGQSEGRMQHINELLKLAVEALSVVKDTVKKRPSGEARTNAIFGSSAESEEDEESNKEIEEAALKLLPLFEAAFDRPHEHLIVSNKTSPPITNHIPGSYPEHIRYPGYPVTGPVYEFPDETDEDVWKARIKRKGGDDDEPFPRRLRAQQRLGGAFLEANDRIDYEEIRRREKASKEFSGIVEALQRIEQAIQDWFPW
ncbi:unnamed protein product [Cyprideis torosa]|uniref:Uncharacterized protein n=1 Tax=Cyprideis torosa TaxID=163714 RepID=A0A7R8W9M1_9CRUS|nr:unnamed protein product [Cyprideis torosa]CAG0887484.1 unnamed protein product [Cyprideis torosa]